MRQKIISWLKRKLQKYQILEQLRFNRWLLDTIQQKAIEALNEKKTEYYAAGNMQSINICNDIEAAIYKSTQDFKLKAMEKYHQ